jgi:hypothetical protein
MTASHTHIRGKPAELRSMIYQLLVRQPAAKPRSILVFDGDLCPHDEVDPVPMLGSYSAAAH